MPGASNKKAYYYADGVYCTLYYIKKGLCVMGRGILYTK